MASPQRLRALSEPEADDVLLRRLGHRGGREQRDGRGGSHRARGLLRRRARRQHQGLPGPDRGRVLHGPGPGNLRGGHAQRRRPRHQRQLPRLQDPHVHGQPQQRPAPLRLPGRQLQSLRPQRLQGNRRGGQHPRAPGHRQRGLRRHRRGAVQASVHA